MIDLIIKDGLGNQMFQYAFARCLQYCYMEEGIDEEIVVNPYYITRNGIVEQSDERFMSLQHLFLNNKVRIACLEEQKKLFKDFKFKCAIGTGLLDLFKWRLRNIKDDSEKLYVKRAKKGVYYTYKAYSQYPLVLSPSRIKHIFGFFQSEYNFKQVRNHVKSELMVKTIPSEQNVQIINEIRSCNSICLHIRRGDYLNARWKNLQVCDYEYYNKAVNLILKTVESPIFYVFSNTHDDIEWIKHNYVFENHQIGKNIELRYVDMSNPDYEELRLMYNCKHLIISNSTFSWWAAYLCQNPNKQVIAPGRWNLSTDNDWMIYQDSWIKIV